MRKRLCETRKYEANENLCAAGSVVAERQPRAIPELTVSDGACRMTNVSRTMGFLLDTGHAGA